MYIIFVSSSCQYSKFIEAKLTKRDIELARLLADAIASGPEVPFHCLLGSAGQILVSKVFPRLKVNLRFYVFGDRGSDYVNLRVDTKTTLDNCPGAPILWLDSRRLLEEPPPSLVYIAVAMSPEAGEREWKGRIFGFATITHLRKLYRSRLYVPSRSDRHLIGFHARHLYPPSWLKAFFRYVGRKDGILEDLFGRDELMVLMGAFNVGSPEGRA